MKLQKIFFAIFLFINASLCAQTVTDDFSDGNFTNNPPWTGNVSDFVVNTSFQLQLNATVAGTSYLSTASPSPTINDMEWRFFIRLNFSPSNNNLAKVYLVSDQADLSGPLNGYYLKFGENGSLDAIELHRQTGTASTLVLRGTDGLIANAFAIRVKVTRSASGNWALFADANAGVNFLQEATGTDNVHQVSSRFGIICLYTVSNINRFYFDDFYAGPVVIDNTPPEVVSVLTLSNTEVQVNFSEGVELSSAENVNNYFANNGLGNPASATRNPLNPSQVTLAYSNPFQDGLVNNISISGVKDFSGNTMLPSSHDFYHYIVKAYDIVFNEIMADPTPVVGLPEFEYLELYNRAMVPVNLKDWVFSHGTTNRILPDATILPDSFLVLSTSSALPFLQQYGNVVAVPSLSSTALTNAGATLTLKNTTGNIIHAIEYSDSWYQDNQKKEGGWSLEQIDPANPCGGISNWKASIDASGGTPGRKNSVRSNNPDVVPPQITGICIISDVQLQVNFSETIDTAGGINATLFTIDNGVGNPAGVVFEGPVIRSAQIYLNAPLDAGTIYTLTIGVPIVDCAGNQMTNNTVKFIIDEAQPLDVVINELMLKPEPRVGLPEEEYIELYNRAAYPVNLKDWTISIGSNTKSFPCTSIMPGEYAIVTHINSVRNFEGHGRVIGVESFAVLANTAGTVTIRNGTGNVISHVSYTDDWYQNNNKKNGGWSIEQIDPNNPCAGMENWKASVSPLGGTPGKVNSVKAINPDNVRPELIRVALIDEFTLRAYFSEPLLKSTLTDVSAYTVDNGVGNPVNAFPLDPDFSSVMLTFSSAFQYGVYYHLSVTSLIKDCAGNPVVIADKARFALPDPIMPGDIIINEILFNPKDKGVDFVEIYNRSNKVMDLKDLRLSSADAFNGELTSVKTIDSIGFLIFPEDYLVLTTNPEIVREHYYTSNPKGFVKMPSMPTFANASGRAVLSLVDETVVDRLDYNEKMQFPLLNSYKGVSLERIDTERPTQDLTNWHSASESVGYATPGYQNSQYKATEPGEDAVTIEPKVFSPDNDGYNDVVNILYNFDEPGYVATITIYDSGGRVVKYLTRSELLGTSGVFSWDGINEAREKASIGIYIIFFEAFDLKGNVKKFKKTCVLGGRL
jgi:hypothetical protein